jgi:hypothetical protein
LSHKPPLLIVAVIGSSGAGKSVFADMAVNKYGFTRMKFAGPLKRMLKALGATEEDVNGSQEHRNKPQSLLLGKSWRYAMQTLGTEWRNLFGKNLWTRIFSEDVRAHYSAGIDRVVIDDMRFLHEVPAIREWGGIVVAIRRPKVEPSKWDMQVYRATSKLPGRLPRIMARVLFANYVHPSEGEWMEIEPDFVVNNVHSLKVLIQDCETILRGATNHQSKQVDVLR